MFDSVKRRNNHAQEEMASRRSMEQDAQPTYVRIARAHGAAMLNWASQIMNACAPRRMRDDVQPALGLTRDSRVDSRINSRVECGSSSAPSRSRRVRFSPVVMPESAEGTAVA